MIEKKEKIEKVPKFKVGDKIMGYHESVGLRSLVGGEIKIVEPSKSIGINTEYEVKLEPELVGAVEGKEMRGWLFEDEAQLFKQETWNKAVKHWLEHLRLQKKAWLEFIRMHRSLRDEDENISDEELEKQIAERRNKKIEE